MILVAACGLIVWKGAVFPHQSIAGHDALDWWIPAKRMIALDGPTAWNPHVHSGAPRIGDLNMGTNPLLLLSFLPDAAWVNLWVTVHLLIGAFGMRAWAVAAGLEERPALVAALFYVMSSVWAGRIYAGHLSILAVMAWGPVTLACLERLLRGPGRRRAAALAASAAALLITGHAQMILTVALMGAILLLDAARRSIGWVAVALGCSLLLGAVHLLPAAEIFPQTDRMTATPAWAWPQIWLAPRDLLRWIVPAAEGKLDYPWERMFGPGVAGTLLTVLGIAATRHERRTQLMVAASALIVVLASGPVASGILPLYDHMRAYPRFLLFAVFAGALLAGRAAARLSSRASIGAATALCLEGALTAIFWIQPRLPPPPPITQAEPRLYDTLDTVSNWAGAINLESVRGYDPLILRRYLTYYHAMFADGPPDDIQAKVFEMSRLRRRPLFDLLGIRTILTREPLTGPGFIFTHRTPDDLLVYRNARALPRAFTVPEAVVGDPFLLAQRTDPRAAVALREGTAARHEGSFTEATILDRAPGYLDLLSESAHPRFLVIGEINHSGWKASVDGRSVDILPAWEALMCIPLEAGDHRITLTYAPTSLVIGKWISLFAWVALAAAAWRR